MDNIEFKMNVQKSISDFGFIYCKKNYYCDYGSIIAMINLQKSNYEDGYYINFGFLLKELHNGFEYPKLSECDIMGRFSSAMNTEGNDIFQLVLLEDEELDYLIKGNVQRIILPVLNKGIKEYFEIFPKAIHTAKIGLKEYLSINNAK